MVDWLTCSPLLRPERRTLAFSEEGAWKKSAPGAARAAGASTSYLPQWALHFGDAPSHTTVVVRLPVLTTMVFSAVLPGAEYAGSLFTGRGIFLERGPAATADVMARTEMTMRDERRRGFMGFKGAWFKRNRFNRAVSILTPQSRKTPHAISE